MARMESAMLSIEQANRQLESFEEIIQSIRGKTQVINAIVFKTQLLSFNASIEAARAGQYGRGFAVVAEEVGKLAQMSGDASKEIDSLLGDSQTRVVKIVEAVQERVSEGKDVTGEALQRFSEIARQIGVIAEKINHVGDASAEQASGIEQTARAMEQMNSTALENKRGSEELFKVAEKVGDLSSKIRNVTDGIRRFVREEKNPVRHSPREVSPKKMPTAESRAYSDGDVLDIVGRLSQRKANAGLSRSLKHGQGLKDISADDPSFKKMGPS